MDPEIQKVLDKKAKRKATASGKAKPMTVLINFLHQSFFYLDNTERWMRVAWEIVPTFILLALFSSKVSSPFWWVYIIVILFCVHTFNWIFNNNFWNCINCAFPRMRNRGTEETIQYLNRTRDRLNKQRCITGVMLIGSLCRFEWHERSDIDMRILRATGVVNGVYASLLVTCERIYALLNRQPLDVYLADTPGFLERRRKDEVPVFLIKRDKRLNSGRFPMEIVKDLKAHMFKDK